MAFQWQPICSCRRSTDLMSDFFSRFYTIQRNISRMIFLVESIVDHRKVCLRYRLHTIRAVVFIFIVLFTLVFVFTYRIMFLYFVRGDLGFGSLLFSMCILTYVRQQSGEFKFRGNCNIYIQEWFRLAMLVSDRNVFSDLSELPSVTVNVNEYFVSIVDHLLFRKDKHFNSINNLLLYN